MQELGKVHIPRQAWRLHQSALSPSPACVCVYVALGSNPRKPSNESPVSFHKN
jgi:hypothetical protein